MSNIATLIEEAEASTAGNAYLYQLWLATVEDDGMSYDSFVENAETDPSFLG